MSCLHEALVDVRLTNKTEEKSTYDNSRKILNQRRQGGNQAPCDREETQVVGGFTKVI